VRESGNHVLEWRLLKFSKGENDDAMRRRKSSNFSSPFSLRMQVLHFYDSPYKVRNVSDEILQMLKRSNGTPGSRAMKRRTTTIKTTRDAQRLVPL